MVKLPPVLDRFQQSVNPSLLELGCGTPKGGGGVSVLMVLTKIAKQVWKAVIGGLQGRVVGGGRGVAFTTVQSLMATIGPLVLRMVSIVNKSEPTFTSLCHRNTTGHPLRVIKLTRIFL